MRTLHDHSTTSINEAFPIQIVGAPEVNLVPNSQNPCERHYDISLIVSPCPVLCTRDADTSVWPILGELQELDT